jgi:hypothetical protein
MSSVAIIGIHAEPCEQNETNATEPQFDVPGTATTHPGPRLRRLFSHEGSRSKTRLTERRLFYSHRKWTKEWGWVIINEHHRVAGVIGVNAPFNRGVSREYSHTRRTFIRHSS